MIEVGFGGGGPAVDRRAARALGHAQPQRPVPHRQRRLRRPQRPGLGAEGQPVLHGGVVHAGSPSRNCSTRSAGAAPTSATWAPSPARSTWRWTARSRWARWWSARRRTGRCASTSPACPTAARWSWSAGSVDRAGQADPTPGHDRRPDPRRGRSGARGRGAARRLRRLLPPPPGASTAAGAVVGYGQPIWVLGAEPPGGVPQRRRAGLSCPARRSPCRRSPWSDRLPLRRPSAVERRIRGGSRGSPPCATGTSTSAPSIATSPGAGCCRASSASPRWPVSAVAPDARPPPSRPGRRTRPA